MSKTKRICYDGMGIALFVVLSLCLQVPVFENYYLCLGYIVMAFYSYYFGIFDGTMIGTVGVFLYCFLINGLRGMPGWMVGNAAIGIICGFTCSVARKQKKEWKKWILILAAVVLSTAGGILGLKSIVEMFLYAIPFTVRVATNMTAFIADVIVLIVGFAIVISCDTVFKKAIPEI